MQKNKKSHFWLIFVLNLMFMGNETIDKAMVKAIIKELIIEDPNLIKQALKEIMLEEAGNDEEEFHALIKENFKRFDKTFKALA